MKMKITADIAMTVCLLLLAAYELVGQAAHEWIGTGMLVLFLWHHSLNLKWINNLFRGKFSAFRWLQSLVVIFLFVCMIGLAVSGIMLSRHVFSFLTISSGKQVARTVHMLCAYWGFALMSLHLGFHWNMMLGFAGRLIRKKSATQAWFFRSLAAGIAFYGVYALINRKIVNYMLLLTRFVFFNFDEPMILFFMDYAAVMILFVWIGHYLSAFLRKRPFGDQGTSDHTVFQDKDDFIMG